ncbi:MAG: hypothetical protein P8H38_07960 [Flavobacteriaceae bacterium]|jgi:hypothetical protein|nr:hypothetical protein [Flavobacteriaceae bacterium]
MRTNKNIESTQSRFGIRLNPKSSKGQNTVPKNNSTIAAIRIEIMEQTARIKKKNPRILKIILGTALIAPSKN